MREKGYIEVDGHVTMGTLQCCHCGGHFEIIRGSGKKRGFCMNCGSVTCGQPQCHRCIPFEKKLELSEEGKISGLSDPRINWL